MALTGTDRGQNATNTAGETSLAITPGSNFSGNGSWAVLCVAYDNSGTNGADPYTSINDSHGNTGTSRVNGLQDPGVASAGMTGRIFTSPMNIAPLTTSSTITVSFGTDVTVARAWTLMEVASNANGGVEYITGAAAASTAQNPSITTSSITAGDMVIGATMRENNSSKTGDADTTNGSWSAQQQAAAGTTAAAAEITSQRKVVTGTGTQTYNITTSGGADSVISWIQLRETIYTSDTRDIRITGANPQMLRPSSDVSTGAGVPTPLYAEIDETPYSDADYVRTDSSSTFEVGLSSASTPGDGVGYVRYRLGKSSPGGTVDLIVALYSGATLVKSWTHNDVAQGFTAYEQELTALEIAGIPDYTNLRLRVQAVIS